MMLVAISILLSSGRKNGAVLPHGSGVWAASGAANSNPTDSFARLLSGRFDKFAEFGAGGVA